MEPPSKYVSSTLAAIGASMIGAATLVGSANGMMLVTIGASEEELFTIMFVIATDKVVVAARLVVEEAGLMVVTLATDGAIVCNDACEADGDGAAAVGFDETGAVDEAAADCTEEVTTGC